MLSRRLALAGPVLAAPVLAAPVLAGLPRAAAAQTDAQTDLLLLAPDGQPASVKTAADIAARLGAPAFGPRTQASRGILDAAARLADRPAAVSAMLPSVALAFMTQSGLAESVVYALRFIARLGISDLHVLASQRIGSLDELAGRKVNLGPQGSATQATAAVLLDKVPVRVDPLYLDHDQALAAVLRGDIAAMLVLDQAPSSLFLPLRASDPVHFLPVANPARLTAGLLPAQLLPGDYPQVDAGNGGGRGAVATVGVPSVLACFNWSSATPMFAGLARLCDLLAEHGSGLRGYDLAAEVAGWERFPPMADWLARGRAGSIQDAAFGRRRAPPAVAPSGAGPAPAPSNPGSSAEQRERLFQQFLKWRRGQ